MPTNEGNAKKTLWVYAVVLFTSAFIVLLITGYSQIKFNKSIDDYESQINAGKNERSKVQLTLSSVLEENRKLKNENAALKNENAANKKELEQKTFEVASLNEKNAGAKKDYEALLKAQREYNSGNLTACALLLAINFNKASLDTAGLLEYNRLRDLTFDKAAVNLYQDGYYWYMKKNYDKAIEKLTQSVSIKADAYYSDDCYYFIAYSEYRKGNFEGAKNMFNKLLENYPQTTYKEEVQRMLNLI